MGATDLKPRSTLRQPQGDVLSSSPVLCPGGDQSTHNFKTRNQCADEGVLRGDPPLPIHQVSGDRWRSRAATGHCTVDRKRKALLRSLWISRSGMAVGRNSWNEGNQQAGLFYLRNLKTQKKGWFLFDKLLGARWVKFWESSKFIYFTWLRVRDYVRNAIAFTVFKWGNWGTSKQNSLKSYERSRGQRKRQGWAVCLLSCSWPSSSKTSLSKRNHLHKIKGILERKSRKEGGGRPYNLKNCKDVDSLNCTCKK